MTADTPVTPIDTKMIDGVCYVKGSDIVVGLLAFASCFASLGSPKAAEALRGAAESLGFNLAITEVKNHLV